MQKMKRIALKYIRFLICFVLVFSVLALPQLQILSITANAQEYIPGVYTVKVSTTLRLRSEPNTSATVLDNLPNGTVVRVTQVSGGWGYINHDGKSGWISLEYTLFNGNVLPHTVKRKVIDVSHHQGGNIDWKKVKADGVQAAIIRLGVRGYGSGNPIKLDDYFLKNYKGATDAGLPVGVYFYGIPYSVQDAIDEANFVINVLKNNKIVLEYPVYFDIEYEGLNSYSKEAWSAASDAFMKKIEEAGYYAGLYTGRWNMENKIDPSILVGRGVWVAEYNSSLTETTYKGRYEMWQYSESGRVNGIYNSKGELVDVDMNWCYVDYPTFIKNNGYNGFEKPEEPEEPEEPQTPGDTEWRVIIEPTYESDGQRALIDKVTEKILKTELIPRLRYRPGEMTVIQPPTESENGFKAIYCLDTNKLLSKTPIPKTSSGLTEFDFGTESDWQIYTPESCQTEGWRRRYAKNPGYENVYEEELIEALPHEPGEANTTDPDCEHEGSILIKCKHCETVLQYTSISTVEHSYGEWEVKTKATRAKDGTLVRVCEVCGGENTKPYKLYDLNEDGKVDASDARFALRFGARLDIPDKLYEIISDDGAGKSTWTSIARSILRIAAKLD